jgi:hypothetical protein
LILRTASYLTVSSQGVGVELDPVDRLQEGFVAVLIVPVQGKCVAHKIAGVLVQAVALIRTFTVIFIFKFR